MNKTAGRALLTGGLRTQVRRMLREDGLSVDEVAAMLDIPAELISAEMGQAEERPQKEDPATARIEEMETELAGMGRRVCEVYAELLEDTDSALVRLRAADRISDILAGKLRPRKEDTGGAGGVTVEQINVMLVQAQSAYERQMAAAKITTTAKES